MCLLIACPNGSRHLKINELRNAYANNPDGIGISYAEDGVIYTQKNIKFEELLRIIQTNSANHPCIIHFRLASFGTKIHPDACHPFAARDWSFAHNGTLSWILSKKKDGDIDMEKYKNGVVSDTVEIFQRYLQHFDFQQLVILKDLIEPRIYGNKFAFLSKDGGILLMNESDGNWRGDGNWYSNSSYENYLDAEEWFNNCSGKHKKNSKKLWKWWENPQKEWEQEVENEDLEVKDWGNLENFEEKEIDFEEKESFDTYNIDSPQYVFVYGTLKRGFGNHKVMEKSDAFYIGEGKTTYKYPLFAQGLPYLMDVAGLGYHVEGEIYEVEDLSRLDLLEGHPNFYRRKKIKVRLEDVEVLDCWVYFLQSEEETLKGKTLIKKYEGGGEWKIVKKN